MKMNNKIIKNDVFQYVSVEEINDMFIQDDKHKKVLTWDDWQNFLKAKPKHL